MEVHDIDSFLSDWSRIRKRTSRVIRCIPQDHLEWSYREGKFTLGDLVRHLAVAGRYLFAEIACGRPSRYPGHGRDLADGYDPVLEFFERMDRETAEILRTLTGNRLRESCTTPAGVQLKVRKWLHLMVEHECHHRGQIYTYLGMLEVITPPLFGLTAEEVIERSEPLD